MTDMIARGMAQQANTQLSDIVTQLQSGGAGSGIIFEDLTAGELVQIDTGTTTNPTTDTTAPTVTASPASGTYSATQTVTLSANEASTIYYTLDGSTPTTSSQTYTAPISISATTTLKYFAKDTAGNSSSVQSQTYTISVAPSTIVSDSFNRADNTTSLGSAETGQAWQALVGTWGVINNQAYTPVATANAYAVIETGKSDFTAQVKFANSMSGNTRFVFRCVDTNNLWLVQTESSKYRLYKKISGTFTAVGALAGTVASGDVIKVVASGASITVYLNETQILSATDSALQTATLCGIGVSNETTSRFDDFLIIG